MRLPVAVVVLLTLTACRSAFELCVLEYEVRDHPDNQLLELVIHNDNPFPVCLPDTTLPGESTGSEAAGYVLLRVGDRCFSLGDLGAVLCSGVCPTAMAPGQTVAHRLPYEAFDLPPVLFGEKKEVTVVVGAYRCDSPVWRWRSLSKLVPVQRTSGGKDPLR